MNCVHTHTHIHTHTLMIRKKPFKSDVCLRGVSPRYPDRFPMVVTYQLHVTALNGLVL